MVHTVQNPTGPNRTLQDHTGPHQINRDYEKNIKDHIGLYTTIKDTSKIVQEQDRKKPTGPYQAIKLHTVVYSSIQTIRGHTHTTRPYMTILGCVVPYRTKAYGNVQDIFA